MAVELLDNAVSLGTTNQLIAPIGISDTVLPTLGPASVGLRVTGGQFRVILIDTTTGNQEIVLITDTAWTSQWTCVRGVENSTQYAFPSGAIVKHIITRAGLLNFIAQNAISGGGTGSGGGGGSGGVAPLPPTIDGGTPFSTSIIVIDGGTP